MDLLHNAYRSPKGYGTYRIWSVVDNWGSIVGGEALYLWTAAGGFYHSSVSLWMFMS